MSAREPLRGCPKSAAFETGTAKAAEVTSAKVAAATTKATTVETTTTESSASTTAGVGPCRLTKTNKGDDY
jgi:hypothetical protein